MGWGEQDEATEQTGDLSSDEAAETQAGPSIQRGSSSDITQNRSQSVSPGRPTSSTISGKRKLIEKTTHKKKELGEILSQFLSENRQKDKELLSKLDKEEYQKSSERHIRSVVGQCGSAGPGEPLQDLPEGSLWTLPSLPRAGSAGRSCTERPPAAASKSSPSVVRPQPCATVHRQYTVCAYSVQTEPGTADAVSVFVGVSAFSAAGVLVFREHAPARAPSSLCPHHLQHDSGSVLPGAGGPDTARKTHRLVFKLGPSLSLQQLITYK
uniref:uncharacterized protein n=1 Tax=Myxine glutinosa TaxID=7769 RepID=UPI00358E8956